MTIRGVNTGFRGAVEQAMSAGPGASQLHECRWGYISATRSWMREGQFPFLEGLIPRRSPALPLQQLPAYVARSGK